MNICFVLPRFSRTPIGGYKIVYEYANRLTQRGNRVCIYFINEDVFVEHKVPAFIKPFLAYLMTNLEPRWFELESCVEKLTGNSMHTMEIVENMDVIIATGVQTVDFCESRFSGPRKYYLIQGYENWDFSDEEVAKTYNVGFTNIVISSWLKGIVDSKSTTPAMLIKNPIDLSLYVCNTPIQDRELHTLGLLYHKSEVKGLKYSFEVIKKVKKKYPNLRVYMFGAAKPGEKIEDYVSFTQNASAKETVDIYNKVSIFLCSSIQEGYGLTGVEAMACGAVLVTSGYSAVYDYAEHNVNSLISPVKDVDAMVNNVCMLFDNKDKLYELSQNGMNTVKKFSWEIATEQMMAILKGDSR